jgi:peptidyl-prolyl cis-trans isomerase SurA
MGFKKRLFWWSTGLLLCACLAVSGYAETLERTVAIVNGDIILYGDVLEQIKSQQKLHATVNLQNPEEKSRLEREVLQGLIRQRLAEQEVKRMKIVVSKGEVDSALADILRTHGGLTEEQFDTALAREGTNAKQFREKLKKEIERAKLMERAVKSKIVITEAQIDARMNAEPLAPTQPTQVAQPTASTSPTPRADAAGKRHLAMIFLPVPNGARADTISQTEKQARKIHGKLKDGGDFAKLAREHSHGPGAADGGDIGYVGADELASEIEKGIHSLSVGAVSEVIKTPSGFYILKILGERDGRAPATPPQAQAQSPPQAQIQPREAVRRQLFMEELGRKYEEWIREIEKKAFIKITL